MKNIYLIGMMGAGKTVTGKMLAEELSLAFIDLDERIVQQAKMSVNEIFESRGEPYFRRLEKEDLKHVSKARDQVVATGGGAVLDPENVRLMKETGIVIYLRASMDELWDRVQHKTDRPLLRAPNPVEIFARLFAERRPLYESSHDYAVQTGSREPHEVLREILQLLGLESHERT